MMLGPKTLVGLLVTVNLLAGGVASVALDRAFVRSDPRHGAPREKFFDAVKARLDLDPVQEEKVRAVFKGRCAEYKRIMDESRARVDEFRRETDLELAKVLRPDQIEKLAELRRERDKECRGHKDH